MSEEATLLYLETDDEVTSVARRLREADGERVVLVAPGRSRATSSVVALRLLARIAEDADRQLAVVGDALTRSLAAEAGLDAYASVDDARTAVPAPAEAAEARRASIHVVRGDAPAGMETVALAALSTSGSPGSDTATRAVPVVRTTPESSDRASRRAIPLAVLLGGLAALVIGAVVLGATVLPAATVTLVPASEPLGPVAYEIRIDDPVQQSGTVEATAPVTATGTYPIQVAATGTVVLYNWTFAPVTVPAGTFVAAGEQAFATQAEVVVPRGRLTGDGRIGAGDIAVAVAAAVAGPAANVGPGCDQRGRQPGDRSTAARIPRESGATGRQSGGDGRRRRRHGHRDRAAGCRRCDRQPRGRAGRCRRRRPRCDRRRGLRRSSRTARPGHRGSRRAGGDPRPGVGRDQRHARLRSPLRRPLRGHRIGQRTAAGRRHRPATRARAPARRRPR